MSTDNNIPNNIHIIDKYNNGWGMWEELSKFDIKYKPIYWDAYCRSILYYAKWAEDDTIYTTARTSGELLTHLEAANLLLSFKYLGTWTDDNSLVQIKINKE